MKFEIVKVGTIEEGVYPISKPLGGIFAEIQTVEGYILKDWSFKDENGKITVIPLIGVQYKDAHDIFGYNIFELMDLIK
jgi:hypothetical protein